MSVGTKIVLICGTRPELIKLAPLGRCLGKEASVIYTGQHHDDALYNSILRDLGLPGSFQDLRLGSGRRGSQLGRAVAALDHELAIRSPAVIVVQGDTTSALAGALAANTNALPLVHVEAGLRSHDRAMPEEHNRVLIDHLSDLCCAPTELNRRNLLAENVPTTRITVTGNTVVEALLAVLPAAEQERDVLAAFGVNVDGYVLATIHRPENVDTAEALRVVLGELAALPLPVVFPLHPRTAARLETFGLTSLLEGLRVVPPCSYPEFLALMRNAAVVVSDSGGVQEEVSVLKRPVVVVRRSTERPEIEGTFGMRVLPGPQVGEQVRRWLVDVAGLRAELAEVPSPYGNGTASLHIAEAVRVLEHRIIADQPDPSAPYGGQASPQSACRAAR